MIDPWDKAAECEHALRICADDPDRKALLRGLRDLWRWLAREQIRGLSEWRTQAENANGLHAELLRPLH
jgi:hypothetical protein